MYQPLICRIVAGPHRRGDHSGRFAALIDAQDMQRLAHPLVDGMRRNTQLERDFLGRQMLVDQRQALTLSIAKPRHAIVD